MRRAKKKPVDLLDDETFFHELIVGFVNTPMNYGHDICAVGTLALQAGVSPCRAIAKVKTFYHHRPPDNVLH